VPSGAITSERPWRSAWTAGASASIAAFEFARSTKTTPAAAKSGPKTDELQHQYGIERALVVEEEDRRTPGPEMLLAFDAQIDAGEGGREVAPDRPRDVDRFAQGARREACRCPRPERRPEARIRESGADEIAERRAAAAVEAPDGPEPLLRDLRQAPVGIRRTRPPDLFEQGEIVGAVGIEVALGEVEPFAQGERAGGF
jgi:hypothetical protein